MHSITIGKTVVNYDIVRTDRKTLGIVVDPDKGLIVRSPERLTEEKIQEVVESKASWILEKLDKVSEIKPEPSPKEFMSGEKLPYLGRRYRLKVITPDTTKKDTVTSHLEGSTQVEVELFQGKFIVSLPQSLNDNSEDERRDAIRQALIQWYRKHAALKINERVNKYKGRIGVNPNRVRVKEQKKRWGSCSSKGNININWKIIMAPMSIVDYIVVHELVHLKYNDHSQEFWKLVEAIIPDYEQRQEWLRVNGRTLNF